jgi:hypothetical protein
VHCAVPEDNNDLDGFTCVTQSLLAEWLRERHNIHVIPKPIYDSENGLEVYGCDVHYPDKNNLVFTVISKVYPVYVKSAKYDITRSLGKYEEAMEEGLKTALNLIESEVMK